MSFYGTIYNQISNAFSEFFVKNSGVDSTSFLSNPINSINISADGREGKLSFDSGNAWIQLKGSAGTESSPENNFCKIYHSKPNEKNLTTNTIFVEATEIPKGKESITVDLSGDNYLKVNNIDYDEAGHISNSSDTYLYFKQVNAAKELDEMKKGIEKFENDVNSELGRFDKRLINTENFAETYEQRVKDLENIKAETRLKDIEDNIGSIDDLRNETRDSSNQSILPDTFDKLDRKTGSISDYLNVLYAECSRNAIAANKVIELLVRVDELEKQIQNK